MSIISSTAHSSGDTDFYPFEIGQSLRFDGSSYLEKTNLGSVPAANSYTFSVWAKIIPNSGGGYFFSVSSGHGLSHQPTVSGAIQYFNSSTQFNTSSSLRDYNSWYHIVFSAVSGSHARVYTNGVTVVDNNSISVNNFGGSSVTNRIGAWHSSTSSHFTGYLAEINFIDGSALTPTSFGETKNGVWVPKDPSGLTYGTNGFRLSFSDATSTTTLGYDSSLDSSGNPNNNDWTVN